MDTKKCFDKVEDELVLLMYNTRKMIDKTHKRCRQLLKTSKDADES